MAKKEDVEIIMKRVAVRFLKEDEAGFREMLKRMGRSAGLTKEDVEKFVQEVIAKAQEWSKNQEN